MFSRILNLFEICFKAAFTVVFAQTSNITACTIEWLLILTPSIEGDLLKYNHMTSLPPHLPPSPSSPSPFLPNISFCQCSITEDTLTFKPHCHIKSRHLCAKYFNQPESGDIVEYENYFYILADAVQNQHIWMYRMYEHPAIDFTFWNEWMQFMFDLEHRWKGLEFGAVCATIRVWLGTHNGIKGKSCWKISRSAGPTNPGIQADRRSALREKPVAYRVAKC